MSELTPTLILPAQFMSRMKYLLSKETEVFPS